MKKYFGAMALTAVLGLTTIAAPASAAELSVSQVTLRAFPGSVTSLSEAQLTQVKSAVEANPSAIKFICTGIRAVGASSSENTMVRKRAKAACDYAKSLNANLSVWVQSKSTAAKSYVGKVLLTIKSPGGDANSTTPDEVTSPDTPAAPSESEAVTSSATSELFTPLVGKKTMAQIQSSALKEISRHLALKSKATGKINFVVSSDYQPVKVKLTKEAFQRGMDYFSSEYQMVETTVILFTPETKSWAQKEWDKAVGDNSLMKKIKVYNSAEPYPCKGRELGYTDGGVRKKIYYNCDGGLVSKVLSYDAHGATHFYQDEYKSHRMPVWLVEGSATFYGSVLAKGPNDPEAKLTRIDSNLRKTLRGSDATLMNLFHKYEAINLPTPGTAYPLGSMLYTVLVGRYGQEKAFELFRSFNSSADWQANFESVYGMTPDAFYEIALPTVRELNEFNWR